MKRSLFVLSSLWMLSSLAIAATKIPATPTSLVASPISSSQVQLKWSDQSQNEQGFVVQRSLSSSSGFAQIATVGASVVTYIDSSLSPSTTYYYRVAAFNRVRGRTQTSNFSNVASATTLAITPPPTTTTTTTLMTTTTTVPSNSGGEIDPNAVVISPAGSDSNPCTVMAPCASLERAQVVVRSSAVKKVYLRAGVYNRTKTFVLTVNDSGQIWSHYPGDPVNSAILDASGMTFSFCANTNILLIQGGSNITINGLRLRNFDFGGGITIHGGTAYPIYEIDGCVGYPTTGPARGNVISNNVIHDLGSGADNVYPWGWFSGVTTWGDVQNTVVKNNAIYNMGGTAISFGVLQSGPANGLNNSVMSQNLVYNTNLDPDSGDLGGLYVIDRTGTSTGVRIENNFLRDYGNRSKSIKGIYLDDNASNVTVKGNIVSGSGTFHVMIHSGRNNAVMGNIFDIGAGNQWALLYQNGGEAGGMSGNSVTNNLVIGKFTGTGNFNGDVWRTGYSPNGFVYPRVEKNLYWNYDPTGGPILNQGDIKDASPVTANPQLFGWSYVLSSTSPAYSLAVGHPQQGLGWGQPGFWGPPGFSVPQTGTAPSSPY